MSALASRLALRPAAALGARPTALLAAEPLLVRLAAALVVAALVSAVAMGLDPRTLGGQPWSVSVWAKPLKFQLALALQCATMAWALATIAAQGLRVPGRRAVVAALVATVVFEAAYITLQGARGVPSHFNRATLVEGVAGMLMAAGATVLVGTAGWIGAVALGHWLRGHRAPMLLAIGLGFVASFVLAGLTGSEMGRLRGAFVEPIVAMGPVVPLSGWRLDIGDLRISHFFGVHAMQAVPLAAWLVRRASPATATLATVAFASAWAAATLWLMRHALAGQGWLA